MVQLLCQVGLIANVKLHFKYYKLEAASPIYTSSSLTQPVLIILIGHLKFKCNSIE